MDVVMFAAGAMFGLAFFVAGTLFEDWLEDREARKGERRLRGEWWDD